MKLSKLCIYAKDEKFRKALQKIKQAEEAARKIGDYDYEDYTDL